MRILSLFGGLTLVCLGTGAMAQGCQPPRLLATLSMSPAEPGSDIRTVPVTIDGATRQMALDTGGAITQISDATIRAMNLPVRLSSAQVYDITGRVSNHFTMVEDFGFGDLHRRKAALLISPESGRPYAGEIAQDMLQPYDIDIDFGAGLLRMYSKDHCPGPPGWTRLPTGRVEMFNKGWHLHIPVVLDGHTYDAIFDTGSRHTIMRLPAARRDFGLTSDSPDMAPYRAINGDPFLDGYVHTFTTLSFGGIMIDRPAVLIVPDVMNRNADRSPKARNRALRHNAGLILPDLSLGMDVLKHLHLFLAFGEHALYVAPADADFSKPAAGGAASPVSTR